MASKPITLSAAFLFGAALANHGVSQEPRSSSCANYPICDSSSLGCDELPKTSKASKKICDFRYRTPAMIGDFFGGTPTQFRADAVLDRLMVVADDLDVPGVLPGGGSTLTLVEPGPVGVFSTSITSVQQLQSIFRASGVIPGATLVGTINDNASATTIDSISQIQAQLASTGLPYDIIVLQQPSNSYTNGVAGVFATRNAIPGTTTFDASTSGGLLQGGADTLAGGEDLDAFYFYNYIVRLDTRFADPTSGGVGRLKIAEGGAILPTDRVYCRYSLVHNPQYGSRTRDLNRFIPGIEKTFFDGLTSLELRAPFSTDAISSTTLDGSQFSNGYDTRFGNLTLYAKALLYQTESMAWTGGLGIALPTARDTHVNYANGQSLLSIENNSVHLQPFLGGLYTPSERFFAQGFVQLDAAASGNRVLMNTGTGLNRVGTLTDTNQIFVDGGIGYWLYRSNAKRGLTGIVPTLEAHQTSSIQNGDVVASGPFQIGNFSGSASLTSIVAGTTLEFGRKTQLMAGYATPIGGGQDRQFDGVFQISLNSRLGN